MNDQIGGKGNRSQGFIIGMTLNQYLHLMETVDYMDDGSEEKEEDLYVTSRKKEDCLKSGCGTFQIRETEEDNYDDETEDMVRESWGCG